jgi:hypothetical protein
MRVAEAWQQLVDAMETHRPACEGIALFTADDLTRADVAACAAVCADCPLLPECEQYRRIGRPTAGVWAGKRATGRAGREDT